MATVWSSIAYDVAVGSAAVGGTALCLTARRATAGRPGGWPVAAARALAVVLLADAASYTASSLAGHRFSVSLLPLQLCDVAIVIAAAACWWRVPLLVELTYFWGLAGTLQAVLTPDLGAPFPELAFFQFVVGHLVIVLAAAYLVAGLRLPPRPGAARRVFVLTAGYTAAVGVVDAVSGADFMFLRSPPAHWSLLSVLGPWPWYLLSAAALAWVLFLLLELPFRRRSRGTAAVLTGPGAAPRVRPAGRGAHPASRRRSGRPWRA